MFRHSGIETVRLPRGLRKIEENMFVSCKHLRSVTFAEDSELEEIEARAFQHCNLESFEAPRSLRKIGDMAFACCPSLRDFRLNEEIQELGWLCLWGTGVTELRLPPQVRMTAGQLGVGQTDPEVLRLPDGLEEVCDNWLREREIEKLVVPACVKKLGCSAFCQCRQLREVIFEPGSQLEFIGRCCFAHCGIEQMILPASVRVIDDVAFYDCHELSALSFEEGSQLNCVGTAAFNRTQLRPEDVRYPATLKPEGHGREW